MCGVLGLWANEAVFPHLYQGLLGVQHRGQDSAGIVTYDGRFHTKKGNGLVRDIFTDEHAKRLTGMIGIGHTRYPTIGGGRGEDAQPFQLNSPFGIIMAHNGNVVNYRELKKSLLEEHHRLLNSDNDVEAVLNVFAQELEAQRITTLRPDHVFQAVKGVYDRVVGQLFGGGLYRRSGHGRFPRPVRHQAARLGRAAGRPQADDRLCVGERLAQHHGH